MDIDFLKPVLGDELFAQVEDKLNGSTLNIIDLSDGSYIPRAKFDDERGKVKDLNATIADLTNQLTEAKDKVSGVEALQAQVTKLTQDIADKDASIAATAMQYRVKDELRNMKARDADIIMPLLKLDKISDKDGKLEGLAEQVDALQKSAPYLFEVEQGSQRGGFGGPQEIGGSTNVNTAMNDAIRAMSGRA